MHGNQHLPVTFCAEGWVQELEMILRDECRWRNLSAVAVRERKHISLTVHVSIVEFININYIRIRKALERHSNTYVHYCTTSRSKVAWCTEKITWDNCQCMAAFLRPLIVIALTLSRVIHCRSPTWCVSAYRNTMIDCYWTPAWTSHGWKFHRPMEAHLAPN